MYQEALSGLYQRMADFAAGTAPTTLLDVTLAINFKSPYIVLPKQQSSSEILFGQLGNGTRISKLFEFPLKILFAPLAKLYFWLRPFLGRICVF